MAYLINLNVMFTKRRTSPHEYNRIERGNLDQNFSNFYVSSPVDEFTKEIVLNDDGSESVTLTSDIAMLFNQERLDKCSRESLLSYFDSLAVSSPSLSTLRSKLTDDQLISIVKSRFLQSPSELIAYSESLVHDYGVELASLSHHVDVDPSSGPDPNPATA